MKILNILLILCATIITFSSCDKEEQNNAPEFIDITYQVRPDDQLVADGFFAADPPRETGGVVKIYKNSYHHVLRFEDFKVDNGPELIVYLSESNENIDNHINLGALKAASGNFNYTFSVNTDLGVYKHVIVRSNQNSSIYCVASF